MIFVFRIKNIWEIPILVLFAISASSINLALIPTFSTSAFIDSYVVYNNLEIVSEIQHSRIDDINKVLLKNDSYENNIWLGFYYNEKLGKLDLIKK
jgi:hypothetical protein